MTDGSFIATVVNWGDSDLRGYEINLGQLGIVPQPFEFVRAVDLWTDDVVGVYDVESVSEFFVTPIPAHGSMVYKFTVTGRCLAANDGECDVTSQFT